MACMCGDPECRSCGTAQGFDPGADNQVTTTLEDVLRALPALAIAQVANEPTLGLSLLYIILADGGHLQKPAELQDPDGDRPWVEVEGLGRVEFSHVAYWRGRGMTLDDSLKQGRERAGWPDEGLPAVEEDGFDVMNPTGCGRDWLDANGYQGLLPNH
jgi:hypothetical protein